MAIVQLVDSEKLRHSPRLRETKYSEDNNYGSKGKPSRRLVDMYVLSLVFI